MGVLRQVGTRQLIVALFTGVLGCVGNQSLPKSSQQRARIISVQPQGLLSRTKPIEIRFSVAVDEGLVGRPRELASVAQIYPRVQAKATFVDRQTLRIDPQEPYAPATQYQLSVRKDILGTDWPIEGKRIYSFRTRSFGLEDIRAWAMADGIELSLRFSHPVDPTEAEASITLATPEGPLVPLELMPWLNRGSFELTSATAVHRLQARVHLAKENIPSQLNLEIDASLASIVGGQSLGKSIRRMIPVEPEAPLVEQIRPVQLGARWAVAVDLAKDVPAERLMGAVRGAGSTTTMAISPDGPWILGAFSPETTTSLQIGLPLLPASQTWALELPALEPAVRILESQPLLDLGPGDRLEVEHHGVEGLMLTARSVLPEMIGLVVDRLVPAQSVPDAWLGPSVGPILRAAENHGRTPIDPAPLLDALPPGLVLLEVRDERRPWLRDFRYLNRRGLELIVKKREGYAWIRVQDRDGAVAAALIKVLGFGGQELARAKTNRLGVTTLQWKGADAAMVLAEAGRRYAVLPFEGPVASKGSGRSETQAWLIPDRVMLAPGQVIDVSTILADSLGRPISGSLVLTLQRARGARVSETNISVDSSGVGIGKCEVPESTETGLYVLKLSDFSGAELARLNLEVRRRRLKEVMVRVESLKESLSYRVYSEGENRLDPIHGTCRYQRDNTFGGLSRADSTPKLFGPIDIDLGRGEERVVRCPKPPDGDRPWVVQLEGHTRDAVSGIATMVYSPQKEYASVETPDLPMKAGKPLGAIVRLVDDQGRLVERVIDVQIQPLQSKSGFFVQPGARLTPAKLFVEGSGEVLKLNLSRGMAIIPFVPPHGGPWLIKVEDVTQRVIWVEGAPGISRPQNLVLNRTKRGVRAALPFPGRLLLTEEDYTVGRHTSSFEVAVTSEHQIGMGDGEVSGLLVGRHGRWSAATIPAAPVSPKAFSINLSIPKSLKPDEVATVLVEAPAVRKGDKYRIFIVEAASAPTPEQLQKLAQVRPPGSALDTLVTPAFDQSSRYNMRLENAMIKDILASSRSTRSREAHLFFHQRPGQVSISSPWLSFGENKKGLAELMIPNMSGRLRVIVLVRSGDRLGIATAERVVGSGLSLDVSMPSAVRVGDRLAVPIMLENGANTSKQLIVQHTGIGFSPVDRFEPITLAPGELKEVRTMIEVLSQGDLGISLKLLEPPSNDSEMGEGLPSIDTQRPQVSRQITRIRDEDLYWRGRVATAVRRTPAILPSPEQLGAKQAKLIIGAQPVLRFTPAVQGLMSVPPIDGEQAAATVLVGARLTELNSKLGGAAAYLAALERLPAALEDADLWVRAFAAHAALEADTLVEAALRTLADVAASPQTPHAAAYAQLLLAQQGQLVQSELSQDTQRVDIVASSAAINVLLEEVSSEAYSGLQVVPYDGPRKGRMSPVLVNAMALFALELASIDIASSSLLEVAITSAARGFRWAHPAEEALALTALSLRAERLGSKAYRGRLLFDGKEAKSIRSKYPTVIDLSEQLAQSLEVQVDRSGSAEVALVFATKPDRVLSDALSIKVRRLDSSGEELQGPIREGRLISIAVEVKNRSKQMERVLIDIPVPAGLKVVTAPSGAVARPGGYTLVKDLPAGGTWTGRVESRARYAGVWHVPPAKVRLRHGWAESYAEQIELRVDAGM